MFDTLKTGKSKATREYVDQQINNFRNWELKVVEDDIKNLVQLVSMLITELGYGATMKRGQAVQLTKPKKNK